MTLESSRIWFEQQLQQQRAHLADGAARLAELDRLMRRRGQRGPAKPRAPIGRWQVGGLKVRAPAGIQRLALEARRVAQNHDDQLLLFRAGTGFALGPWELRRVEYLAVKLTARANVFKGAEDDGYNNGEKQSRDWEGTEGEVRSGEAGGRAGADRFRDVDT